MPMSPEKAKQKRMRIAAEEGRVFVPKTATGLDCSDMTEYRRQYKQKKRREAGARLRSDIAASTEQRRKSIEEKKALKPRLDDAHVRRYLKIISSRAKVAKRYKENPQKYREIQSERKQKLVDSYVRQNLKVAGVPASAITPRLIELKREAMEYHRIARTLKTAIKTNWKENNETITKHA